MSLKSLLITDKIPFVLALILTGLSLTVNHLITKYTSAPLLEYQIDDEKSEDDFIYTYQISNLTIDKLFRDIKLQVVLTPADTKKDLKIHSAIFYFSEPYRTFSNVRITEAKESVTFPITYLQPGAKVFLKVKFTGPVMPKLVYMDDEAIKESVLILENSFLTWIIKNEIRLNMVLLGFLSICLVIYLVSFFKWNRKS